MTLVGVLAVAEAGFGTAQPNADLYLIEIGEVGATRLGTLLTDPRLDWWVELDHSLLVATTWGVAAELDREGLVVSPLGLSAATPLLLVEATSPAWLRSVGVVPVARGEGWALVSADSSETLAAALSRLDDGEFSTCRHPWFRPLPHNTTVLRAGANQPEHTPQLAAIADDVDANRWLAAVESLAGWNRWSCGTEITPARDWLVDRFSELPGLVVSTDSFVVPASGGGAGCNAPTEVQNVIATVAGRSRPDEWVIVGGHYDSRAASTTSSASASPGAEDNASGCAGVLELARVLTTMRPARTVIFACYAGEEQGLHGGHRHAGQILAAGDAGKVVLMLNMDMIGFTADSDLDVLIETSIAHSSWFPTFASAGSAAGLRVVTSINPFGSDHVPFLQRGMPAVLTIQNDWDQYPHYHKSTDMPQHLSLAMGGGVLRMNAIVLAEIGLLPVFADGFESGDTSLWSLLEP